MDSYPFASHSNFVELLSEQTLSFGNNKDSVELSSSQVPFQSSLGTDASNYDRDNAAGRKGRHKWTPTDDVVLISSWLNTSKDPVVGNEQKSSGFWKRIAAYFAASPLVAGCQEREASHCKQRWHRINDLVSKFCGSYEVATREKTSGQNETDVLKLAHQIFYNNYKTRFTLEHAWKELRNDQKWCEVATAKNGGCSKKRKCDDGADSSGSQATCSKRPPGVKAAKMSAKMPVLDENTINGFQTNEMNTLNMMSQISNKEKRGSSHVDLTYSTDIPTYISNQMGVRTRIRDRQAHEQLKGDLVEHIWRKFGSDQDNN